MFKITYCIYKKQKDGTNKMIKTGLSYEKALKFWKRNPKKLIIYSDI